MKILLVNNKSLNQEKFKNQNLLLLESAKELSIDLDIKTNFEVVMMLDYGEIEKYDAVLFYDKDVILAKRLENRGLRVFNSSDAIANCDSKASTEICLEKANVPRPKTIVVPLSFYYNGADYGEFVDFVIEKLSLPLVCKKWFGSWGEQVYKLDTRDEILKIIEENFGKELLFQEFIKESAGEDARINVVGGKVVASMKRKSQNGDFRANLSNGGVMEKYQPTEEEKMLAIKSAQSVGCDFCGVDILFSNRGALVCEVNSNAHLLNIFKCTGENVAKDILKYICAFVKKI